ncbi:transglutaminase domain-containing protein [bacterium]|nr:transglutaminase domain-containing protein [bacterium]
MLYLTRINKILIALLICLVLANCNYVFLGKALAGQYSTHTEILISSKIYYESGWYAYNLKYPAISDGEKPSNLVLYENGVKLGPAHSTHSQIRKKGKGRFSHWKSDLLYFSSSDNSDPRSNGRKYKVVSIHKINIQKEITGTKQHQYQIIVQGKKEPFNRYIKIENIGDSDIINPKVISDNVVDMSSVQSILKGVITDSMSDKEKAIKLWEFVRDNRYNWYPAERIDELAYPVKYFNVYGYEFCSATSEVLEALWEAAGFPARCWGLADEHVVAEIFYDNSWHMFDPHYEIFYFCRDNKAIASVEDLEDNPALIMQSDRKPVGCSSDWLAGLFADRNNSIEDNRFVSSYRINIVLRPDEYLIRSWEIGSKYHDNCYHKEPPVYANGKIVYTPDLTKINCMEGMYKKVNVRQDSGKKNYSGIYADKPGKNAYIIYKVESPYVIVGGKIGGEFVGAAKMYISFDAENWREIWEKKVKKNVEHYEKIDSIVNNPNGGNYKTNSWNTEFNAKYFYFIKYEFFSDADRKSGIKKIVLSTDIQLAPKSLPALKLGVNSICFSRADNGKKKSLRDNGPIVKIIYAWEENQGK